MPNQQAVLDPLFRALSDPTRRAVLERLGRGPASVGELAAPFEMALPSFMQHLHALEAGGLVRTRKQGRTRRCELAPEGLAPIEDWLAAQRRVWESRLDRMEAAARGLMEEKTRDEQAR